MVSSLLPELWKKSTSLDPAGSDVLFVPSSRGPEKPLAARSSELRRVS
ncbi:unnamed protein product [Spirodela intermedia]|uniref:Uncharacterized protein n=2 Tax=Spirodela intermedia TaxID=51605 RepID=A0A7I8LHH4_SPIIN|nr:unnamed protein product [Spirodela intermedia]CAA6671991.1 unnamed protein product [Spirodela intermedia]CAA7409146.1 unnamed protein product [Spirodela intermedia]